MKRREFLKKTGYGAAGLTVPLMAQVSDEEKEGIVVRRYDMEIEVIEVGPKTRCHKRGEKFMWPKDMGNLCHWLASALDPVVTSLAGGAIYPWLYKGTPYEKVIDPEGVTTEYIRCPDPTEAGIVVKITRTFKDKRVFKV
jgi:uncharacterized repeat protein (TIGR04076 family)